jgi:CheY-like chemotaxis protein
MRFLIIDDSSVERLALATGLENLGHTVDQFDSTVDALRTIESGIYDSVFLDVVMPEQDGYKFLRKVRLNPPTAKQHIIFCSNKNTSLEMSYGVQRAGANDYLPKPVTRESIQKIIENIPERLAI